MGDERLHLPDCGISIVARGDWTLVPELIDLAPTSGVSVRMTDGVVWFEIRQLDRAENELSEAGLDAVLRSQNWASAPFDVVRWAGPVAMGVGGTYRMQDERELVREWFVTDGATLVNCCIAGDAEVIRQRANACDELVWSIQFDPTSTD